tara:strand:- start:163 stop:381 length:219 start_codon:yes stop_codon:yes gene_type:complete
VAVAVVDIVDNKMVQTEDLEEEQDLLVQVEILVERIMEEQETHLQQVQLKDLMEDKILEEVKILVQLVVVEL